jgi:hypothetical protein
MKLVSSDADECDEKQWKGWSLNHLAFDKSLGIHLIDALVLKRKQW